MPPTEPGIESAPIRASFNGHDKPWRSMYLRLVSAAEVRGFGGPKLVAFDDFRSAAHMEPALLCLFSWCLPRLPDISDSVFRAEDVVGTYANMRCSTRDVGAGQNIGGSFLARVC